MLGVRPLLSFPLLTLDAAFVSDTAIVTLRYSTHSFATRSTDAPANASIAGRIASGPTITRSLRRGPEGQFGSILDTQFSELVLDNGDGALDPIALDYFADGRPFRLKIGAKEVVAPTRVLPKWIATGGGTSSGAASSPYAITYPAGEVTAHLRYLVEPPANLAASIAAAEAALALAGCRLIIKSQEAIELDPLATAFGDDWTGDDDDPWDTEKWLDIEAKGSASATIQGNEGSISIDDDLSWAIRMRSAAGDLVDFDLTFTFATTAGRQFNSVVFRADQWHNPIAGPGFPDDPRNGYSLYLMEVDGAPTLSLRRLVGGVSTTLLPRVTKDWSDGPWNIRLRVVGPYLKAKAWKVGDSEPAAWDIERFDAAHESGELMLAFVQGTGAGERTVTIDDFDAQVGHDDYLNVDVAGTMDGELYLMGLDGVSDGEIVVYYIETIVDGATPYKGWAQFGPRTITLRDGSFHQNTARSLVAQDAHDLILGHELLHNVGGLEHVEDTDNIMFPVMAEITNLPPDLTADQIARVKNSTLAFFPGGGILNGDFFIAQITINDRGEAPALSSIPAPWTALAEDDSGALYQGILYHVADGTEAGAAALFDWESGDAANDVICGRIHQFRYVDPTTPIEGLVSAIIGTLAPAALPTVVTTVPNSMAMALASWSDNVSTAGPTGEAGGDWEAVGDLVSTTTGDDAANRRYGAAMQSPGTISGGSVTVTPTDTPQNELSIVRGFVLRGLSVPGGEERVQPFSAFATVFQTRAGAWSPDHDMLRLKIEDLGAKLKDRLQLSIYSGAGGKNGPSELAGRSRPLGFGRPSNVPLQLVDYANFIFQANSGAVFAVDNVYDRGAALAFDQDYPTYDDLAAATVVSGTFATCLAEGYVKVGGGADPGSITADVAFDEAATHSSAIYRILTELSPLLDSEIDTDSFDVFAAAQPAEVGVFFSAGTESTVEQAVEQIAFSGGAFAGQDGSGLYRVQRIEAPATVPHWAFDERSIIFDESRQLRRRAPPYEVPWKSWGLGYDRNWTIQTGANVASGLDPARKIYLESEYRYVYGQNADIALRHQNSRSVIRNTFFLEAADAEAEAARLALLYGHNRAVYEVPIKTALFSVRLGQTVRLTYSRFGLNQGRAFFVLGVRDDGDEKMSDLVVFG